MLVGEPGAGKTTLLRQFVEDLAQREAEGRGLPRWTPLYVRLPRLAESAAFEKSLDAWDKLADFLQSGRSRSPARIRRLEEEREEGRLLILLDGLDEIGSGPERSRYLRPAVTDWIDELQDGLPRGVPEDGARPGLVVTTRPIPAHGLGDPFREARLLRLGPEQQRAFLVDYFRERKKPSGTRPPGDWVPWLAEHGFEYLAGNPLWLTFAAFLIERGSDLDPRRHAFYAELIQRLLEGEHDDPPRPVSDRIAAQAALQELASAMSRKNAERWNLAQMEDHLDEHPPRKLVDRGWTGARQRELLVQVQDRSGILGPYDDERWRFLHRTLQEALTGEALWSRYLEDPESVRALARGATVESLSMLAEPLALVAERIEDPPDQERFFEGLLATPRLALCALVSTRTASEELVAKVLAANAAEGEARAAVLARAFELSAPDPADVEGRLRVADFLARVGRSLDRGGEKFWSELHHLDEVLAAEERRARESRAPELVERCRVARRDLFHDRPFPDDRRAFREVPIEGHVQFPWSWIEPVPGAEIEGVPEGRAGLERGFCAGRVTVTRAMYEPFDPGGLTAGEEDFPVVDVNWYQAQLFCRWLGWHLLDEPGSLPTEAQWEYACRAGTKTPFWSGDSEADLDRVGWYAKNSGHTVHRVGEKPGNAFDLHDVHGNVWEWCLDQTGRGADRVMRGGGFWFDAVNCRSAYRSGNHPGDRFWSWGFRAVLLAPPAR